MSTLALPPLAVSIGEPAGVGPDLILQLYDQRRQNRVAPFIVYGQVGFLRSRAQKLGLTIDIRTSVPNLAEAVFQVALPVVEVDGLVPDKPGNPSPISAAMVQNAISEAVRATMAGECRALVTAPIHKAVLYGSGFRYPGHTEFIAALCAGTGVPKHPVMMLVHDDLRAVPLTVHEPISRVAELVTRDLIVSTINIVAHDLKTRFGIAEPKLAVTGLNPHAGEAGNIGREDIEIIRPAIVDAQFERVNVEGPFPADTIFSPPRWRQYDAVIAMYHDQALIPIKTLAFDEAINMTLGLPIVRTSPDHGTAFDLAGTGKASFSSMLAALRMADKLTTTRAMAL